MARPTKQGIDYFPLDCQFDDKIEMYILEKEANGLAVLICIWQIIYSNEGYYTVNSNDLLLLVKKRINVGINEVKDCINLCLQRGIFDKNLNQKFNILTSKAIQKRYFEAARKKKIVQFDIKYILNGVNVGINAINVAGNATNVKEEEEGEEEVKEEGEESPAQEDNSEHFWRIVFLKNPGIVEVDFVKKLIKDFGEVKAKNILYELREKNFKAIRTMKDAIDEKGNIKPIKDGKNGSDQRNNEFSVNSRLNYKFDPEKANRRLEELAEQFPDLD